MSEAHFAPKYLTNVGETHTMTQKAEVMIQKELLHVRCVCLCVSTCVHACVYRDMALDSVSLSHQEDSISLLPFFIRGQID